MGSSSVSQDDGELMFGEERHLSGIEAFGAVLFGMTFMHGAAKADD